ncbi:MAG: hypothetical protein RLY50_134, partial [Actinomycetota bacterium]
MAEGSTESIDEAIGVAVKSVSPGRMVLRRFIGHRAA